MSPVTCARVPRERFCLSDDSGTLTSGEVAGIVIAVLFVCAAGVVTTLLAVWYYRSTTKTRCVMQLQIST